MKNFNQIKYERIDYFKTSKELEVLINQLESCNNFDNYLNMFKRIITIQNHIEEMYDYSDIKNMRNSEDEFFNKEIFYWNEYKPKFDFLFNNFYELCLNSKYKSKLKEYVPENFFNIINYQLKITSDEVLELKKRENELQAKYKEITREKLNYDGEERSIAYIMGFFSNKDRNTRKNAHDTINNYYYSKQQELDELFFELINIRNEMAKKLHFNNYSDYSLILRKRFGYDYQDIKRLRDNVIKYICPLVNKISEWKKTELGLEQLKYYDTIYFKEMPQPLYEGKELLNHIGNSFERMDKDLASLYVDMLRNDYIDFETRENKVNFCITNYLSESGYPVITGNYSNSYTDVTKTTHEMGHAFQKYNSSIKDKDYIISALLKYPTFEIAEMFSNAMELITLDYLDNIFNDKDYEKNYFLQLYRIVSVLPYECLVDEFQEQLYSTDDLKKEDIRKTWLSLVKKYGLENDNRGHINLDTGGYFYRQSHIFLNPFYYIDYVISYFGAFALWKDSYENLDTFKEMGAVASYYPLKTLIKEYHLQNPFDEESMKDISINLEKQLIKRRNSYHN